jgi:two-component system, chemotaxis family, CheB/CheR fusion protein
VDDELRILVVDDVPDVADSLASLLRVNGHLVQTAYGGHEALDLVESFRPDCVLMDLGMPQMSGGELARQLRERHGVGLVLIAITGRDEVDLVLSEETRHFDHCLRKPVQVSELRKMVPLPRIARNAPGEHGQ